MLVFTGNKVGVEGKEFFKAGVKLGWVEGYFVDCVGNGRPILWNMYYYK